MKPILSSIILFVTLALVQACSCSRLESEYLGITHSDEVNICVHSIQADTISMDATFSSLSGHWIMRDASILYIDEHSEYIQEYSLDGDFVRDIIPASGDSTINFRAFLFSTLDENDNTIFGCDGQCNLCKFDKEYQISYNLGKSWFVCLKDTITQEDIEYLFQHPDPGEILMYEHNFDCDRLYSSGDKAILPIVTEHVYYNGYFVKSNANDFWKHSYILLSCDIKNIAGSAKLLGHYPPFYQTGNFPIFSTYDYLVTNEGILISFAADSKIYVLDMEGHPIRSFGHIGENVSNDYPQTKDFEEYESEVHSQRKKYGYYGQLYKDGDYLFRTYHTEKDEWRLQVYNREVLCGDIDVRYPLEIFGTYNGCYYAYAYTDYENEQFKLVKFRFE